MEKNKDGKTFLIPFQDIVQTIKNKFPQYSENMTFYGTDAGLLPISRFPKQVNWKNHFNEVSSKFYKKGFEVIPIENQVPFVRTTLVEYQNEKEIFIRGEISF